MRTTHFNQIPPLAPVPAVATGQRIVFVRTPSCCYIFPLLVFASPNPSRSLRAALAAVLYNRPLKVVVICGAAAIATSTIIAVFTEFESHIDESLLLRSHGWRCHGTVSALLAGQRTNCAVAW